MLFIYFFVSVCSDSNSDIVIVLQSSASIGERQYYDLMDLSKVLIKQFNLKQTRVGYEIFSMTAETMINLQDYSNTKSLIDAIAFPYKNGPTNVAAALANMNDNMFQAKNGDRSGSRNIGILAADGQSINRATAFTEAVKSHSAGTGIFTLGVAVKGEYSR